MGVNTFLLDRRTAVLSIGGSKQTVGTLRRFFKLTELDADRAAERQAAANITPSPVAVLVMDITDLPMATKPEQPVAAHLVLGWDEGRGSVTDFRWDYLPELGYAVRDPITSDYILYEERHGLMHCVSQARARELKLLDEDGKLIAHGQPRITACLSVTPSIAGYVEADCTFDSGVGHKLLVEASLDAPPLEQWFIGKRPMDVERYRRTEPKPR